LILCLSQTIIHGAIILNRNIDDKVGRLNRLIVVKVSDDVCHLPKLPTLHHLFHQDRMKATA